MIDLHIHTTASDGIYSPEEIVEKAYSLGLEAIAVTDHDTLEGVKILIEQNLIVNPEVLSGVEISTLPPKEFRIKESLHLLGYRLDPYDASLNRELALLQDARENRNPLIIQKLNELGIEISLEKLKDFAGDVQLGRAHIGRYLFETGVTGNVEEAFTHYLGKGQPAYVEKYKIPVEIAIKRIKAAGGVSVLAHPGLLNNMDHESYKKFFEYLKDCGLDGIEVFYPSHSDRLRSFLINECKRLDLIATGGSDFHGYKNEGLTLGKGRSNLNIPYSVYKSILSR